MNKYTRKQINIKPQLHSKQFVTWEDANTAMMQLAAAAVSVGADEDKLIEFLNKGNND